MTSMRALFLSLAPLSSMGSRAAADVEPPSPRSWPLSQAEIDAMAKRERRRARNRALNG